ncbi:putative undecaprenyl-phosphate N-acetylglucosaminyl 1-phosphate transferase [Candidatus Magnetaquicoccaceae bacterium FCR-1]|uniref:Undecaprenyl-phosphate N-acetylglucosaminyl 1-phosphate transferase n=1 Tax=Candidatus Magnetaquiglobus chichijimensis TaxID=3141448 RepID=A0ABQ0CDK1_9PROT
MDILFIAFLATWLSSTTLIRFARLHVHLSSDSVDGGPQKFHANSETPRIGGIPLLAGMLAGVALIKFHGHVIHPWLLILVAVPVWGLGIAEDLLKRIGPLPRLIGSFVSAGLGIWLLNARITHLGIPLIDDWMAESFLISILFTLLAVGGLTHSINIIDGFNGLAGMVVIMILSALAYVCNEVGDRYLMLYCLALIGATLGFLTWNYPLGLIFAGDGGAYLWGFMIAEISVLLVSRNPQVSPWFPLLVVIYPVWETIFTIYRRKFLRGTGTGIADAIHLHSLVYRRLVRWMVGSREAADITYRNSLTSPYLWVLASLSIAPSILFWNNTLMLVIFVGIFISCYIALYAMIVRFRSPSWMVIRRPRNDPTD